MNRVLVTVAYLAVVWMGSLCVNDLVDWHRFNVAERQLKSECTPLDAWQKTDLKWMLVREGRVQEDERWIYVCNGAITTVGDRIHELVQDDGSL